MQFNFNMMQFNFNMMQLKFNMMQSKTVASFRISNTGGGPNFRWPLVLTQRGGPNQVFPIFLAMCKKKFFGQRGAMAQWPPPLNTPLIENQYDADAIRCN